MASMQAVAALVGRVLLAGLFIFSGYGKLMAPAGTQEHMAHANLPMVKVLYVLVVMIELGGGLLIFFGWQSRWAALVVFLFLIPVTLTFHWEPGNQMQMIQVQKNAAIMGGLLMITAFGAGAISMDGVRKGRPRRM